MKGKLGRDTKYTPETVAALVNALEIGHTQRDACVLANISVDTFHTWLKDPKKSEFSEAIKKASLKAKDQAIKTIRKAFGSHWTAAAWYLERKHRDEFAIRTVTDGNVQHTLNLGEEAAKRLAKYKARPKG